MLRRAGRRFDLEGVAGGIYACEGGLELGCCGLGVLGKWEHGKLVGVLGGIKFAMFGLVEVRDYLIVICMECSSILV